MSCSFDSTIASLIGLVVDREVVAVLLWIYASHIGSDNVTLHLLKEGLNEFFFI
ncbi:hypothetical protein VCR31J2_1430002 [Vibrio coralliirubri]|uniref:Uncharacterized protein n=1 Tax=Vibrio coralliirubri TaxID=1516159 RepID=A0AA86XTL5_9VIBR|nr:hypothetical protein VCR29J2_350104 [Vibrio coralliirubri]CDT89522.1 hypothetical protein VCR31J2_1430002 [Vibrio coralliirubri]